jgi:UDP-N-acetylmuramoyl-L-alanyl-D-glutamate--2,6-diaminopimelate ligase
MSRPPLPGGPFLVAGLGRAGQGAVDLLADRFGADSVTAWDAADQRELRELAKRLRARGVRCELRGDARRLLDAHAIRTLAKSPGIPPENELVVAAKQRGLTVVDELEIAWRATPLPLVGITGTKGKSTVTTLVSAIGEAVAGSAPMAGNTDFAPALSAIRAQTGVIACEVSSQQLEGCTDLLPEIGVFTNLHRESNRHGSPEATADLKRTLFVRGERCVPVAIVNGDDRVGMEIAAAVERRRGRVVRFGLGQAADYRVRGAEWSLDAATVAIDTPEGRLELRTRLPGRMSAVNAAAALAAGVALGASIDQAATAIAETPPPPGRYDSVDLGQPFEVLVDMAHTPESIRELLTTLRVVVDRRPGAALRAVVGIPGSYAMEEPREETGRIARSLSDQLIVTGSSMRGEPPLINMASILRGARAGAGGEVCPVLRRDEAIRLAIESARPGDVVVAMGRGPLRQVTYDRHGGGYLASDMEIAAQAIEAVGIA